MIHIFNSICANATKLPIVMCGHIEILLRARKKLNCCERMIKNGKSSVIQTIRSHLRNAAAHFEFGFLHFLKTVNPLKEEEKTRNENAKRVRVNYSYSLYFD